MTLDPTSTAQLDAWRARFDAALSTSVRSLRDVDGGATPGRLADAMEHALLAPGKRLRPLVLFACADALQRDSFDGCLPAALAVEHVHAYSLVHDDLPGMDNDDMRRGKPTVHVAFDEGTAILAGDALLTNAFVHASRSRHNAARIVEALALAAGSAGMAGGQHDDVQGGAATVDDLVRIHAKKTGALFRAAAEMAALAVDRPDARAALATYGAALGLAFQIGDDVLDVTADPSRAGKKLGRDAERAKVTFVSLLGVDAARAHAQKAAEQAIGALGSLGAMGALGSIGSFGSSPSLSLLVDLARFAAARDH